MVRTYHGLRLAIERICYMLLYALVAVPLTMAAFAIGLYFAIPFSLVMLVGFFKNMRTTT